MADSKRETITVISFIDAETTPAPEMGLSALLGEPHHLDRLFRLPNESFFNFTFSVTFGTDFKDKGRKRETKRERKRKSRENKRKQKQKKIELKKEQEKERDKRENLARAESC